jgi:hypothetical protein
MSKASTIVFSRLNAPSSRRAILPLDDIGENHHREVVQKVDCHRHHHGDGVPPPAVARPDSRDDRRHDVQGQRREQKQQQHRSGGDPPEQAGLPDREVWEPDELCEQGDLLCKKEPGPAREAEHECGPESPVEPAVLVGRVDVDALCHLLGHHHDDQHEHDGARADRAEWKKQGDGEQLGDEHQRDEHHRHHADLPACRHRPGERVEHPPGDRALCEHVLLAIEPGTERETDTGHQQRRCQRERHRRKRHGLGLQLLYHECQRRYECDLVHVGEDGRDERVGGQPDGDGDGHERQLPVRPGEHRSEKGRPQKQHHERRDRENRDQPPESPLHEIDQPDRECRLDGHRPDHVRQCLTPDYLAPRHRRDQQQLPSPVESFREDGAAVKLDEEVERDDKQKGEHQRLERKRRAELCRRPGDAVPRQRQHVTQRAVRSVVGAVGCAVGISAVGISALGISAVGCALGISAVGRVTTVRASPGVVVVTLFAVGFVVAVRGLAGTVTGLGTDEFGDTTLFPELE